MFEPVILIAIATAFVLCVALSPLFIPMLHRMKFGQSIRDEGPKSHQKKSGTPTMGGIVVLISIVLTVFIVIAFVPQLELDYRIWLLLLVTVAFGLVGFLDDFIKVVMKRNLGLNSKQKLLAQLVVAAIFYFVLRQYEFSTSVHIPATSLSIDIGWLYLLLVAVMLVGASNAVNLTDGLDGLLAGTSAIAFGAFTVLAWAAGFTEVAIFSAAVVGAVLGFLVFNAHPAKVFMGDTGSLALGGAIAAIAILIEMEILLVLIGAVFVIETLSVIIQVTSYKLTKKRVFKMSPLHHHYELVGWSEWKVVIVFWIAGLIFAVLGVYIGVLDL
ncbi:phospho-N-acetylmuramoyl-pentapeptide-transferase [Geomicrobium sp. JCM 19055]|uniref:phospho-N-acetylmuramoyl-pentapeptide- transferase n=1 Tax=Geomicrobium sp. JCM 19055 TaxID=1460649 RepID=UPI00045EDCDE|nr:phospho-N-acetylmuramoyl-pentapeptide-transferase [Geomicrobium sp. JCM 19055]GAJ99645.1 phospho-N-acetylmuramoyl-pentapeptide-transferase [Geomicrobium sp. JCM 19055]